MSNWFMQFFNAINRSLLQSSLHGILSRDTMLVEFAGKKSGKTFSTPVNYVRDDNTLVFTSRTARSWWKNLRGGAPVRVWVKGKPMTGHAQVFEDNVSVIAGLCVLVEHSPMFRRAFRLAVGQAPDANSLAPFAQNRVIVRIQLE
ncbi:MAG: nitroreductase family deazaflavin-dependent oxidoreductase [Chloroflexi bacterium]|nr:nitroreductase family deazaflavin-dependent oxidoreductase [Chloroflexota bacterium]